jgi:putative FmdB family regulatory protein
MAAYDYRCRSCDTAFTVERPMTAVATAVRCPAGHDDVARIWAAVSVTGRAAASSPDATSAPSGGCCGGGCCA